MIKISKKEIRQFIHESGKQILGHYKISSPSKKSEKILTNFSRKLAEEVKNILKKAGKADIKKTVKAPTKKTSKKTSVKRKTA